MCACFGSALWLSTNSPLCKHLISVGGWGGTYTPVCVGVCTPAGVCLCMCWLMGSQQGARPTYNLLPPAFPSTPVSPFHRSVPSSFNLAAEAKKNGSASHQGTLLVFKGRDSCRFLPLPSPCLFTLPSLLSPPRLLSLSSLQFCLHVNFLRLPCLPFRHQWFTRWREREGKRVIFVLLYLFFLRRLILVRSEFSPLNLYFSESEVLFAKSTFIHSVSFPFVFFFSFVWIFFLDVL